jgi:minor extracellular serine protease Vpr
MTSHPLSKRAVHAALLSSTLAMTLAASAVNAQEQSVPASEAEGSQRWFIEMSGAPVADGSTLASVRNEKAAFRKAAAAAGIVFEERKAYDTLFNGFSVAADGANRVKLQHVAGVKAIYPVEVVAAPNPEVNAVNPDLISAITMTGANVAQDSLGLSGKGIKVGIIDTGIDIDHLAFGGSGSPNSTTFPTSRVVTGYDLVGDAYNADPASASYNIERKPDANPDDCGGHGSHVAGIVGGNGGGIRGVAPGVKFGAYRVFGCAGSTETDVILEALERAYADGMDVINQSLGSGRQWPQYPTAQASTRLVNKGVIMVASIGNNGPGGSSPDGLFAAGAPGVGDKVIGVASYDNAQVSFTVNGVPYGYNPATGSPFPPTSGSLPMARTGTTATTDDACAALPAGSLAGKAVLVRRGTCSFFIKAANAQNAGAAAVVLYNNAAGAISPTVAGTPAITIPVVAITQAQGAVLNDLIAAGPTTLHWTSTYVSFPFGTGGLISGFSSFGLTAELGLKPNIGAPGGGIISAYPLELGGTASLSGTSMSSPHVAGSVALILEARPKTSAGEMQARLQNSADPKNWQGNPALGFLDHVFRQGAGMVDIVGTIQSRTLVTPSQLSLGESEAGPKTNTITVRNSAKTAVTYQLGYNDGLAAGPNVMSGASYNASGVYSAPASVAFSVPSVTVPAGGSASFDVTIAPNAALVERGLYGGYIVLTPTEGGALYRVPFAGFKGDYQTTQVLTPTANGFPWLAQLVGSSYQKRANGGTYTLVGNDVPYFLMHLDHMSRRIRLEAFDAVTGDSWHRVSDDEYVTRSSTPGGFFSWTWDGTTFTGKGKNGSQWYQVPNGSYVVKVSVLKALGDESNPAHWETWTSPVITIARP